MAQQSANIFIAPIDFSERSIPMPRKPALLLSLLNLVIRPIAEQTKASSNHLVALPQQPPAHDREAWRTYWKGQGQPWRTEPEADVRWGDINLTVVKWSQVQMLGDEYQARQKKHGQKSKSRSARLLEYEEAVRANRQLAIMLQTQGLNEDAARFAYRAQVLQKRVFWFQIIQKRAKLKQRAQALGAWLFSWFLYLLAGYGYRLGRSFLAYVVVIIGFTTAYYWLGAAFKPPLSLVNALGLSMTSFHGRGFFPGVTQLDDTLTILTSIEAFVGLILEATFIATLTQRFFGK
jgi:hypothetical protein